MTNPQNLTVDELLEVMSIFAFNSCDDIWWRHAEGTEEIIVFADCSDIFFWGSADCDEITSETMPLLREARDEVLAARDGYKYNSQGIGYLYCAKLRKKRPQGAVYKYIEDIQNLFDACGPPREVGFGNPHAHPSEVVAK